MVIDTTHTTMERRLSRIYVWEERSQARCRARMEESAPMLELSQKVCDIVQTVNPAHLRWLLMNDILPQGAIAKYENIDGATSSIYIRNQQGDKVIHVDADDGEVVVPTFQISCEHELSSMSNMCQLASSIADDLMQQENAIIARLLQESFDWQVVPRKSYGSAAFFNHGFRQIEQHDILVNNVLCNSDDAVRFCQECTNRTGDGIIDASFTRFGSRYHLWTADLVASPLVRPGFVMFLSDPDNIGVVCEHQAPCVFYDEN